MEERCKTGLEPAHVGQREALDWGVTDWSTIGRKVEKIQRQIFQETRAGNYIKVNRLQKLLAKSLPARLMAVRRVTEINGGRHTAGVDDRVCENGNQKAALVEELKTKTYKSDPVRVVWIPKPNNDWRRLGIPTIRDRAMQALVFLVMEPEWEAKFEPHSFGFRPGRSAIDAVHYIAKDLMHYRGRTPHPGWVLDADITKCFDNIDHEALLAKINGSPFQGLIRSWLKSGAISEIGFEETERGTPQGGVISPLLANIALTGLEAQFGIYSETGQYISPSRRTGMNKFVTLYRFADDFIVIALSRDVIENYIIPKVRDFLETVGLSLSDAKTRIVNISEGFTFLGFTFQRFYRQDGAIRDFVYAPNRNRLDRFCDRLRDFLAQSRYEDLATIIDGMNRRIRGFCNYFRWGNAYKAFSYLSHRVWELLWSWCKRRHPKRGAKWLRERYWHVVGNDRWTFTWQEKHVVHPYKLAGQWWKWPKVRILTSPYDPDEAEYWQARRERRMEQWSK